MMQTKLLLAASLVHLVSPLPVPTVTAIAATAGFLVLRETYGWVRAAPAPLTRMAEATGRLAHDFQARFSRAAWPAVGP